MPNSPQRTVEQTIRSKVEDGDYDKAKELIATRGRSWDPKAQRTVKALIDLAEDQRAAIGSLKKKVEVLQRELEP